MIGSSRFFTCLGVAAVVLSIFVLGLSTASAAPADEAFATSLGRATPEPQIPPETPSPTRPALVPGDPPESSPITDSGCCVYPQWSRDSEWILFIHAPGGVSSAGLYGVPRGGGPVTKISARVGIYSGDTSLVAYLENEVVYVERWIDGKRWSIPSSGRRISFSPSGERIAWEIGSSAIQNQDVQIRKIWVSQVDGSEARELVTVHGGGFQGWVEGDEAIIVSGRLTPTGPAGLWRIQTNDGAGRLLFQVDVPRDVLLSPGGRNLAFTVAFEAGSGRNGLWVLPTNGDTPVKISSYGAYRWRGDDQLVVIPNDFEAPGAYLLQFEIGTGLSWSLTSPAATPLSIANNDWEISPDGIWMVYFSSEDSRLRLLKLPEVPNRP